MEENVNILNSNNENIVNNEDNNIDIINKISKKEGFNRFKKGYFKAALAVLLFFGIMNVVCTLFMGIGYVIAFIEYGINTGVENPFEFLTEVMESRYFIIVPILYGVGDILSGVITYLICKKILYKGDKKEDKPKKTRLGVTNYLLIILMAFGLWGVGAVIGNLPEFFNAGISDGSVDMIFGNAPIVYIALAVIGAPIFEEMVFRKFFIDKTAQFGEGLSVFTSALFFGIMHGNSAQFFLAFALGILFGIVYVKTRNILYTMGLHCIINTTASITDIVALFNNPEADRIAWLVWNIAVLVLLIVGITLFIILLIRKSSLISINKDNYYNGKLIFKSKMLLIVFIILTAMFVINDGTAYLNLALDFITNEYFDPIYLINLIPSVIFIAFIALVFIFVGRIFKKNADEVDVSDDIEKNENNAYINKKEINKKEINENIPTEYKVLNLGEFKIEDGYIIYDNVGLKLEKAYDLERLDNVVTFSIYCYTVIRKQSVVFNTIDEAKILEELIKALIIENK